eukprot:Lankesteria_metandrocarpae@DN4317_c0_g1_i1.p1
MNTRDVKWSFQDRRLKKNRRFPLWVGTAFTGLSFGVLTSFTRHDRNEWYDILMDYCHHKRCQYTPNVWDTMRSSFLPGSNVTAARYSPVSRNIYHRFFWLK